MAKLQPQLLLVVAAWSLGLAGCGMLGDKSGEGENATGPAVVNTGSPIAGGGEDKAAKSGPAPNLASGPDVCYRAIVSHLGKDTKVAEFTAFFSAGSDIDSMDREPQGQMKTCSVQYQSPDDPRKLLGTRMNVATGAFSPPNPIEITVMGDASKFRLEDHLIPLSQVNPAGLTTVMEAQKARLSGVYGKYAWTGVRLSGPGAFNAKHTLRLDIAGRLAVNDIKDNGYASVSLDGTKITADHLTP